MRFNGSNGGRAVIQHNVPSTVEITKTELAVLRDHVTGLRVLVVEFNASDAMRVPNKPENHWAFPILADMRGLND